MRDGRGNTTLRRLDETVAVWVLRLLGAFRRRRAVDRSNPRRIGIMKSAGIGDMVLVSAIARDLVAAYPDAEVTLFAGSDNAAIARMIDDVDVVELPTSKPWRAIPLLRAKELDVLLDLGQWTRLEAVYTALARARWTAGFSTSGQRREYAYDTVVPHLATVSELDNFRAVAATLGVGSDATPHFEPTTPLPELPASAPYAVYHMWPGGYRSELREWPSGSWRALIEQTVDQGVSVLLSGGPADVPRTDRFLTSLGSCHRNVASIAGRFDLGELVAVLANASYVVSVNTGVMHLAAATGVRTIGLNGPTSSLRWGPIGAHARSIDSPTPGCAFLNLGFEYDGQRTDCMEGITVARVIDELNEMSR